MRDRSFPWLLLAAAVFAVFIELGRMDVVSDNEGQRAAPPAEMLQTGNFVIPTINGETYLNKPPLLYWAIAGVYTVTGRIDALTARIPTAVAGVALLLFAYLYLRRRIGEVAARWAALALLASPYVLQMMRVAELDVPLTLATFAAVAAYHEAGLANGLARSLFLAALGGMALGAAILLKGPVPFLFLLPAWIAFLILNGDEPEEAIRTALLWTFIAFAIGLVLFVLQFAGLVLGFPVALTVLVLAWVVEAWRYGGSHRLRHTLLLMFLIGVGLAVVAPWAVMVPQRTGWAYLVGLLHSQVTERTYFASAINSGDPLYFVRQLLVMLAPWGFLLPLQYSRMLWDRNPGYYRFATLAGWLSVSVFSLIAGKETEYVLPAVPLLLAAAGVHLAAYTEGTLPGWPQRWVAVWVRVLLVALPMLALGGAGYAIFGEPYRGLIVEAMILALVAMGVCLYAWRRMDRRLPAIFAASLLVIVIGLLIRSYHYTGENSPQELARLAGNLARQGYRIETIGRPGSPRVYPAFAFYAGIPIPVEIDPEAVRRKLEASTPYYYVAREKLLTEAQIAFGTKPPLTLTKSYTSKDLLLIGNRPLP